MGSYYRSLERRRGPRPSSLMLSGPEVDRARRRKNMMLDLEVDQYLTTGQSDDISPELPPEPPVVRERAHLLYPSGPRLPQLGVPREGVPRMGTQALPSRASSVPGGPRERALDLDEGEYFITGRPRQRRKSPGPLSPLSPVSPLPPSIAAAIIPRQRAAEMAPAGEPRLLSRAHIHSGRGYRGIAPPKKQGEGQVQATRSRNRAFIRAEVDDYLTTGTGREKYSKPQEELDTAAMPPLRSRRSKLIYEKVREPPKSSATKKKTETEKKLEALEYGEEEPSVPPVSLSNLRSRLLAAADLNDGAKRLYERYNKETEEVGGYTRKY